VSRPLRFVVLLVALLLVAVALAWLSGYNFDHRSPWVGGHAALALAFAFIFAGVGALVWEDME
jgi:hypothetical protein